MKPESQDENMLIKLIVDQTIYCNLGVNRHKRVYEVLDKWIRKYEEEEKSKTKKIYSQG